MNEFGFKYTGNTAALLMLLVSCGESGVRLKAKEQNRATSFQAENVRFGDAVGDSLSDSVRFDIANAKITFSTSVSVTSDPFGVDSRNVPVVRVTIVGPKGDVVESRVREGEKVDWEFVLRSGDGDYEIRGELGKLSGAAFIASKKSWVRRLRLDASAPAVVATATLNSTSNGAGRTISLRASVTDFSSVTCRGQLEPGVKLPVENIPFDFVSDMSAAPSAVSTPVSGAGSDEITRRLVTHEIPVPDDFPNRVITRVTCLDTFGHSSEVVDVASFNQPSFTFGLSLVAPQGIPYEELGQSGAQKVALLSAGTAPDGLSTKVKFVTTLIDRETALPVPASVMSRERGRLQLYLTDYEVTDLTQLATPPAGKTLFLRKSLVDALEAEAAISSSIVGKSKIYFAVSQLRESDGSEVLLGTRPFDIYVEPAGARWEYSWISGHQFVPAASNASISLRVKMRPATGIGTTLQGDPVVEYSLDNSSWTVLPSLEWAPVAGAADEYTFIIRYPFSVEKPFRVRLKGTSMAGNQSVSTYSRNLVAPSGFVSGGSLCGTGFGVRAQLGSSFLCQREVAGVLKYFYMTVFESMGSQPLSFTRVETNRPCSSDYCFQMTQTTNNGSVSNHVPADPLRAATFKEHAREILYFGEYEASYFESLTSLSATFALNNAACSASPDPAFVVKSATQGAISPFSCSE